MEHIKPVKKNKSGKWNVYIDWDYVKAIPDSVNHYEQAAWLKYLSDSLYTIKSLLNNDGDLIINDIKGYDNYHGPYANVTIKGEEYKIWTVEEENNFWIENYPISEGFNAGFKGTIEEIANVIGN